MQQHLMLSRLLDNHSRGTVGEFLKEKIRAKSTLSVVSAYFTIYAFGALKSQLESIDRMRFLFGEPNFIKSLDPKRDLAPAVRLENDELRLEEQLRQSRIARACAEWIQNKVEIRSIRKPGFLHGKAYHIEHGEYKRAVLGSSNFTVQGLGLGKRGNIELNLEMTDDRDRDDLKAWFDNLWSDTQLVEDVKVAVLEQLEQMYVPKSPQFVYYKTLFHLFPESYGDAGAELKLPQKLQDSEIWQQLFEFQRHGATAIIRKLQKHQGCILADSVGLGKTYTALAVIKYFENLNDRVLVLTPKKLRENWTIYQAVNNSPLNPFLRDRLAFTTLSHSDLSRERGIVGDVNLERFNWDAYDLVVIDESHNFRNNIKGKRDESGQVIRKSRYERLLEEIINSGARTKVLLLSATPVNNDLSDLRNQITLISGDNDHAFAETLGVNNVKDTLAAAQRQFLQWSKTEPRVAEDLLERLSAGFFSLLDGLTLARSRQHIRDYYAHEVTRLGGFPTRLKPISYTPTVDTKDLFPSYEAIHDQISGYRLALFNPNKYVLESFKAEYNRDAVANFSQANREQYLIGMMKVNFLKRLESSVHSFAVTLERTCDKIQELISKLETFQQEARDGAFDNLEPDALDDEELLQALQVGKGIKYDLRHLDVNRWLRDLRADHEQLTAVLEQAQLIKPNRDAKLTELRGILERKVKQPTRNASGEENRKTLVFTAFSDTAQYLYRQLEPWARQLGVHIALVTGDGTNASTYGKSDYNTILTHFAPRAKKRDQLKGFLQDQEIDILIATDCISEGQNLQDCDQVVNYDIHWNPVRLIQRFGRIDRIGSLNPEIQMINFWATPDLNAYLNLKNRVEARMALVDITGTTQDNPLTTEQIRAELSYRDQQLLRLKDEVLDLEDLDGGVTLADFSLDDFRMDLNTYLEQNKEDLQNAPLGLFGLVNEEGNVARPGIVFCLKQIGDVTEQSVNPLAPYFLVYVRANGEVRYAFAQAKQTLELYRALCTNKTTPMQTLHTHFDQLTNHLGNLENESRLLRTALESIRDSFKKRTAQNLFAGRGTVIPKAEEQVTETTAFQLVTWLVILEQPQGQPLS
jgi:hypothetical protein